MKYNLKHSMDRTMSLLMALIMLFSCVSLADSAQAAEVPVSDYTFDDYTSGYHLTEFLNGYNVLAFGNALMNIHCMGSVLIQGSLDGSMSGYSDGVNLPPSYIKGMINAPHGVYNSRHDPDAPPLYVGSVNTVTNENGQYRVNGLLSSWTGQPPIYVSDDFFNFQEAYDVIKADQATMASRATVVTPDENGVITINVGDNVKIESLAGVNSINIIGDMTAQVNTTINIMDDGDITAPLEHINGKQQEVSEQNADGTSIVFSFPNADTVKLPTWTWVGHVIAPDADVSQDSGNYNGCIICDDLVSSAEGHVYNYNTAETSWDTVFSLEKEWNDGHDADGLRPDSIQVQLLADGQPYGDPVTLTAAADWYHVWPVLPEKDASGNTIVYSVKELNVPAGYTVEYDANAQRLINRHDYEEVDITVTKKWVGEPHFLNTRPVTLTVYLYADGVKVDEKTITVTDAATQSVTFTDLPRNAGGVPIVYTIEESQVPGYLGTVSDAIVDPDDSGKIAFDLTNTWNVETTQVSGIKTWNDDHNRDGLRPTSIVVELLADGVVINEHTATAADGWRYSFTNLPKTDENGQTIVYTVREKVVPTGYTTRVDGYNLINDHEIQTLDLSGKKTWADDDNNDGKRPESITVILLADLVEVARKTVTAADNWQWEFTDMPKNYGGKAIHYTVQELTVEGYTSVHSGMDLTNTHENETVDIAGAKTWDDDDNNDGKRPVSITINLLQDGKAYKTVTVTEADDWAWSFTDLPRYTDGHEHVYTITEDAVESYTSAVTGYDVTNTHENETVDVLGLKVWDDNNNNDGKRPNYLTVYLLKDGVRTGDYRTTNAQNNWYWIFEDLPRYTDGKEHTYTFEEAAVPGYSGPAITRMTILPESYGDYGYILTNTHEDETVEIAGRKTWNDMDNQDGKRPTSITIRLWKTVKSAAKDNHMEVAHKVVTAADNWAWDFGQLPRYEDGKEILYTITEDVVEGYSTTINSYDVTNRNEPSKISVSGMKYWVDGNDQDGIRPQSITVHLFADGTEIDQKTVTAADGWKWRFDDLDEYKAGKKIVYTITEDKVEGYTSVVDDHDLINTHTPETVSVSGKKTWNDADDQDGIRPTSISINLMKSVDGSTPVKVRTSVVTANHDWKWSFVNLPKYENGKLITYTITEDKVEGYTAAITGYDVTNTHITEKMDISGSKTWDDHDNQDGLRPQSITIKLWARVGSSNTVVRTMSVTESNGWKWSFTDLPVYQAGQKISYTITEDAVPGYSTQVNGYDVINHDTPDKVNISGLKYWVDNNDQDGIRPDSITIRLLANGQPVAEKAVTEADAWKWSFTNLDKYDDGVEITYTIEEDAVPGYDTKIDGYDVINTHKTQTVDLLGQKIWEDSSDNDGLRPVRLNVYLTKNGVRTGDYRTTNAERSWYWIFRGLPMYENGELIEYGFDEDPIPGYERVGTLTAIDMSKVPAGYGDRGLAMTNKHENETTKFEGTKTWDDANNQDGLRPERITIRLWATVGAKHESVKTLTVQPDARGVWSWSFTDLPKYENGQQITYTITEDAVPGYSTVINGYDVTNIHVPGKVSISGMKYWLDADDQDGIRPQSITVNLLADGVEVDEATVTEQDDWKWVFADLPEYNAGRKIVYTITEDVVEGYTTFVDQYDLINTHVTETVDFSGKKTWNDADNQDGLRPTSITIRLWKTVDGKKTEVRTAISTEARDWKWSFVNLPRYENGKEIIYSITEDTVAGYETTINGFDAENTHQPETIDVEGAKTWNDNDNQDGKRPVYITINLLADGQLVRKMNVTEQDGWKWRFTDLPKYKGGKEIRYTITEEKVEGYTAAVNGYDVTNTHVTELIGVTGHKIWEDDNNRDMMRPASIVIHLLANGKEIAKKTVTADNGWAWSFTDLPRYEGGKEIRYTITEDPVEGYTVEADGYNLINSHHTLQLAAAGVKVWQDARNRSGIRPTQIVLHLLADGVEIAAQTVNATTDWSYDFGNVPKYDQGREIVYTIIEEPVAGYVSLADGFGLTNTEVIHLNGRKTWLDDNNSAGARPASITINLLADGMEVDEVTVTAEDDWSWSFAFLPKYNDQEQAIAYTITEDKVPGYITEINGYDVTNRYASTDFSITKVWEGGNGGMIDLTLYANGERISPQPVYDRMDDVYRWDNLPKYDEDGEEIVYSATERYMDGYMTIYKNYGEYADKTKAVYDGGEIINRKVTSVYVRKVWSGLAEGEETPEITLTLYCNGEKVDRKTPEPDEYGWYRYYNLPVTKDGKTAVYTVAEEPLEGYIVSYQTANGEETDIAHNGDTIINTRVPKTGDSAPLVLWTMMLIISAAALVVIKRRRA